MAGISKEAKMYKKLYDWCLHIKPDLNKVEETEKVCKNITWFLGPEKNNRVTQNLQKSPTPKKLHKLGSH